MTDKEVPYTDLITSIDYTQDASFSAWLRDLGTVRIDGKEVPPGEMYSAYLTSVHSDDAPAWSLSGDVPSRSLADETY
jgi:hypothetical protein